MSNLMEQAYTTEKELYSVAIPAFAKKKKKKV